MTTPPPAHPDLADSCPEFLIQDSGTRLRRSLALGNTALLSIGLVGALSWVASRPILSPPAPRTVAILDLTECLSAGEPLAQSHPSPAPLPGVNPTREESSSPDAAREQASPATPSSLPTQAATAPVAATATGGGGASGNGSPLAGKPGPVGNSGSGGTDTLGTTALAPRFDADYLNNPAPKYPARARRFREEGKVTLRVLVSPDGLPLRVELRASSGFPSLDQEALITVQQWRFQPARLGPDSVSAWVLVPIFFSLRG